uniref:C2H2-type domain-containing protein n=1 Tax=Kalanchoe fedtschenkoi TaxID=63787 RepID=A0A7N0RDZ6_KALFE
MDHQQGNNSILKRKRSKLQRPFVGGMADGRPNVVVTPTTTFSSLSSEDQMPLATEEEEEEDREVAKCLILLAQAHNPPRIGSLEMMSSRKWWSLEDKKQVNRGGGVYECKTCNRSFHSFQALGGHRTSHKKPRITTHDETPLVSKSPHMGVNVPVPTIAALQLGSRAAKTRVHECAICGAEFASGQALGGHMRRHRVTNSPQETSTTETKAAAADGVRITLSLLAPPAPEEASSRSDHNELLSLDLNLPAASSSEEDETRSFLPEKLQDSGLGLSTPALVDCHY